LIDIVIVNWNSGGLLYDCIDSLIKHHDDLINKVIVVDNASSDDSIETIDSFNSNAFEIIIERNLENLGFGKACNQGACLGDSESILFLNPDARIFHNSLSVSLNYLRNHEDVGVVGVQLIDEKGEISRTCAVNPTLANFLASSCGLNKIPKLQKLAREMVWWDHKETRKVDHVMGAYYLIDRTLFESLNGFDERFFVYLEDLDLSLRVKECGYEIVFLTDTKVFHVGGGTSSQVKARRLFYSLSSQLQYGFKHYSLYKAWLLVFFTLSVEPLARLLFAFVNDGVNGVKNTLSAYKMLIKKLPIILQCKSSII